MDTITHPLYFARTNENLTKVYEPPNHGQLMCKVDSLQHVHIRSFQSCNVPESKGLALAFHLHCYGKYMLSQLIQFQCTDGDSTAYILVKDNSGWRRELIGLVFSTPITVMAKIGHWLKKTGGAAYVSMSRKGLKVQGKRYAWKINTETIVYSSIRGRYYGVEMRQENISQLLANNYDPNTPTHTTTLIWQQQWPTTRVCWDDCCYCEWTWNHLS